jgi:hypothetical protein
MQTYVLSRLGIASADTSRVSEIKLYLNAEVARIVTDYALTVSTANLSFTAGNPVVSLPTGTARILAIRRGDTTMQPITWQEYAEYDAAGLTADGPLYYFRSDIEQLRIIPSPDQTTSSGATLWYVPTPSDLVNAADTPSAIPKQFHLLPCERVVALMAAGEEAVDLATDAETRALRMVGELERFLAKRSGEGSHLIPLRHYRR